MAEAFSHSKAQQVPPMVLMAGGNGKRLGSLSEKTPKPLLPIGNKPLLAHQLEGLKEQNFQEIWVSAHHQAEQIEAFLEEFDAQGLEINLLKEPEPLGTAGVLGLLKKHLAHGPFFVLNVDILTILNFQAMQNWHTAQGKLLTMGYHLLSTTIPYGMLQMEGGNLLSIQEKPVQTYPVNAGVYLLEPGVLTHISPGVRLDMTDLIETLLGKNIPVGTFQLSNPWIDVGSPEDYHKANEEYHRYLPKRKETVS